MNTLQNHSAFLRFERKDDRLIAEAAGFQIAFLRLEFVRLRAGMADFLVKVATPRDDRAQSKQSNTILTLRCKKNQATPSGAIATAKTIIAQMKKRNDESTDWNSVSAEHLGAMLLPTIKFFALNTNTTQMEAVTEALS